MDAILVLALLAVAVVLFCMERIPVDVVALGLLVALLVLRILTPAEALAGFASEPVVVIAGIVVLTAGLRASGLLEAIGRRLERFAGNGRKGTLALLLVVATVSAFMNNTTTTAAFLPVAVAMARAAGFPPGRLLMPMAFASILGGSITLVGTSTNVIVSGLLTRFDQPPLGMFELAPVAAPAAVLGMLYLVLFGDRLLAVREEGVALEQSYHVRDYLSELVVESRSPLAGKSIAEARLGKIWDLNLLAIVRAGKLLLPGPADLLQVGDHLLVEGSVDALLGTRQSRGLRIREPGEEAFSKALHGQSRRLVEAVVLPRSDLVGRTLKERRFRQRFGAGVIALKRHGEPLLEKLGHIRIRVGDVLLILGHEPAIDRVLAQSGLLLLSHRTTPRHSRRSQIVGPATLGMVVGLATTGLLELPVAVLLGCLLLLVCRTVTPQEAYAAIDWRMLVLIAGMMGYATALAKTGGAELIAKLVLEVAAGFGPVALLASFYALTVLLTQPMSNQSAALVVLPLALGVAIPAGIEPRAMAVTIALAASSSFLTPLEPSCLLVYGPGRYKFRDFPRLGLGLTLLAMISTLLLVPRLWPLEGGS